MLVMFLGAAGMEAGKAWSAIAVMALPLCGLCGCVGV